MQSSSFLLCETLGEGARSRIGTRQAGIIDMAPGLLFTRQPKRARMVAALPDGDMVLSKSCFTLV